MGAGELEALRDDPSLMEWPDGMPEEGARKIAARMLEDVRAGKPDLWEEARVGVRAADDYTLEMELRSPMPQLPLLLLHCTWFPVPRHAVEAHGGMLDRTGKWTRPGAAVGNGPFLMAEHRFNDYVEVRRNPRYRNASHRERLYGNPHVFQRQASCHQQRASGDDGLRPGARRR